MRSQRGLSLIELLVGSAVGLFIVVGASKLFVEHLRDNRRLLLDARLHQDLRAATALVARDLRRAGYWQQAIAGTTAPPRLNPYRDIAPPPGAAADATTYSFSRDAAENHRLDLNEAAGFRLAAGTLQTLNGGSWQALTDPAVLRITRFAVTPDVRRVALGHLCVPACSASTPGCPRLDVRSYRIDVQGQSTGDASVQREIRESVRVRNDDGPGGTCP